MATVPYTPFPTVMPSADAIPSQQIPADEATFGAEVGGALRRTGAVMRRAADEEFALSLQFAQMENETKAMDAATEFSRQANKLEVEYSKLNGQQAVDALPALERNLAQLDAEIGKGLKSPIAQRSYKTRSSAYLTSSLQTVGMHAAQQASFASEAAKVGAIQAAQSRFTNHFGIAPTEPDISEIVSLTSQLAFERGLPKEAADVLIQKNVGDALAQVMGVKIFQGRSAEARDIFEEAATKKIPGTDLPVFSGERLAELGAVVKRAEEAEALDKIQAEQRAHAAGEAERRKTQDEFLKRMAAGQLTAKDVLASNLDPFGSGSKQQFMEMLKAGVTNGEMRTNNELYIELFNRIHAPDGFPGKITDENDLNQYFGNGLNATSLGQLRGEITGRRTQEGGVIADLKKNFLDAAKSQISGSNPLLGIADPKGDEQYYRFLDFFLRGYDKAIRAGEDPAELLSPDGVFAKSIARFKREPSQWTADLQAAPSVTQPPPQPVAPTKLPMGGGVMRMGTSPFPEGIVVPANSNPRDTADWPHGIQILPTKLTEGGETYYALLPALPGESDEQAIARYRAGGPDAKQFGKFRTQEARDAAAKNLMRPTVKFSPSTKSYWWQEGGQWKSSQSAPRF